MEHPSITEPGEFGSVLLEIGISLLNSGASCERIRITMTRFATAYDFIPFITIGPKSISLTLNDKNQKVIFNGTRSTPAQGINFKMVSGISRMSWSVAETQWSLLQIKDELYRLHNLAPYPQLIILCSVSLAGSAFCYSFGGSPTEMLITFGATFCGLFVRRQLLKKTFNTYICTYLAALTASLFTRAFYKAGTGIEMEQAFATCVLFRIPGVPFLNSFTDMMDGNIMNGMVKGMNALIYVIAIAFGLLTAMLIYNFNL
jgi:uncharacterized membrane protein YjjP (DUF1212 family)